jgi:pyruvate formate-lyase/glycerol dehydratase family glycyl radical enzyme
MNIDTAWLEKIDRIELSERARALKQQLHSTVPGIAVHRAVLATQSWQESQGEPTVLRRAKLVKKVLEGIPIVVFPGQRLVGNETEYFRGCNPQIDFDGCFLEPLLAEDQGKMTLGGPVEKGVLKPEDWNRLLELARFWQGKTAVDKARALGRDVLGSWYDDLSEAGVPRYDFKAQLSGCLLFDQVVHRGVRSLRQEAQQRQQEWVESRDHDLEKLYFWQAVVLVLQGVTSFAKRHAIRLMELAAETPDPERRRELEEMADICAWVPEHPARTFREALQSVVLVHLAVKLETPHYPPTGFGCMDQYLYPYFRRDVEQSRLSLQEAADLLSDFFLYAARLEWIAEISWRDYFQKNPLTNLGLAGTNEDGEEVSNELSYLFLHVAGLTGFAEPHVVVRWTKDTPRWLLRKAMQTNLHVRGGVPQFQNGDLAVAYMIRRGVSPQHAHAWVGHGCSQAMPSDQCTSLSTDYLNVPLCVDLALHNGMASKSDKQIGCDTGDPRSFKTFEEFYDAFKKQVDYVFRRQMWYDRLVDQVKAEHYPQPLASAFLPGCLEKGVDFTRGGLHHYRLTLRKDRGIIPAADSLTAIKKLVYEDKTVTMDELLAALEADFEGASGQEIGRVCQSAPKYGNDEDEADLMVRDLAAFTGGVIQSERNIFGFPYAINRNGQAWHYFAGKRLAALPNGRKAGQPLADGSLSPMQGVDRKGLTALLGSALKADFKDDALFGILNVKLPGSLVAARETQDKLIDVMTSYFRVGGTYIQFNILDAALLREAKRHPEQYRDLVVRVAGYSAYFVHLSPDVQDEIIARTEHSLPL